MEYQEACEKLALMIIKDNYARVSYGWPIVRMALTSECK